MSPTSQAEALLHPVRLRIVLAIGSGRMTTAALSERLPDVPHATLYRQVAALATAGLLEVVDERRVRGGVERTYALVRDGASLGPDDVADVSDEDLMRGFAVFAGALIEAFARYVEHPDARPAEDLVSYRQATVWADRTERAELVDAIRAAMAPYLEHGPGAGRQQIRLSTIAIPELDDRADAEHAAGQPTLTRDDPSA